MKKNKTRIRLNRYFGKGTWGKLHKETKEFFVNLGAHKLWCMMRSGELESLVKKQMKERNEKTSI